ncbi:hypothetical protein ACFWXK_11745 [Streptomyces sp. NPDC059070]|uniref:hypothetical protein n=1 Tax=Streptomyces sp. NPDC059070 TaxID=3346713 RepID=UPI003690B2C0
MNSKNLKISAAAVMAALALGVAAPMATASEARPAAVSSAADLRSQELNPALARQILGTPALAGQLTAAERADLRTLAELGEGPTVQPRSLGGSAAKAAWALIKKAGPAMVNGAKKAASKGVDGVKQWAKGLSWSSPIRWAVGQLPAWAIEELIRYLFS